MSTPSSRHVNAYAVIMAGGFGTRFWPRSRRRAPKQFLAVRGKRTLLQSTVDRLGGLVPPSRTFVVATREFLPLIRSQLPRLPRGNVLVEPAARGTAACVALAAAKIARDDPRAVMAAFPADHVIDDRERFRAVLNRAFAVAQRHRCLVTFGIEPTHPETGYGYIRRGEKLEPGTPRVFRVTSFREKPDTKTARRYLRAGYLWNSGIFVWGVDVFEEAAERHAPRLACYMRAARSTPRRAEALYRRLPTTPVDTAVMEHADNAVVVEARFAWSDVGSWAALGDLWGTDAFGNARRGPTLAVASRDTVLYGDQRLIAVLGVQDLIVIDSPDAILVCPRSRAQEVRRIVEAVAHTRFRHLL